MAINDKQIQTTAEAFLDKLADTFLLIDSDNLGANFMYSDKAAMNALLIFNSVTSNRSVHKMLKDKIDMEFALELSGKFGAELNKLFLSMTGIDSTKYYK